jgi:hypothetical protein
VVSHACETTSSSVSRRLPRASVALRGRGCGGLRDTLLEVSMKLKREKAAKKPELTDAEIHQIRAALQTEPEWMQIAFDISLHTGCRLRETWLPLACIGFGENKITFPSPKDGEDRAFSIPMPTALQALFQRLKKREAEVCFVNAPATGRWSAFKDFSGLTVLLGPGKTNVVRLSGGPGGVNVGCIKIAQLDTAER